MSRSGYSDDDGDGHLNLWRGAVERSLKGKRGQAFLRELAAAMDAMPDKKLTTGELEADGQFCALGVVGQARGKDLSKIDTEDWTQLSREFGISEAMAREIMYENDEFSTCLSIWEGHFGLQGPDDLQEAARWRYMRRWVESNIVRAAASIPPKEPTS